MKKSLFIFIFNVFFACFLAGTCFTSPDVPAVGQEEEDAGYSGLSGKFGRDPKDQRIAMLLEEAKVLDASGNLEQVFSRMGKQEIGFKDLIEYKADHIGDMASELRKGGMDGIEADRKATAIWNEKYQNIERRMVQERQNSVKKVWHSALMEYIRRNPNSPVLKGDIGGWATESFEKMSFSSDIDFTLFFVDVDNAVELRDMFENKIKEHFGLDMRQFDAFCTAQRKAALDVYIGEWGAKWGEVDMIKRGKAEIWQNEDGQLKLKKVPAEDVLIMYHIMGETLTEDTFKPTADMEPGISMELYRHIEAEIIRGKFTTIDKIIKMCKYIDRSAVDHKAMLGKTDAVDSKVAILARRVTEAKQTTKDPADMSRKIISLVDGFLGKGWANDPEKAIKDIADRGKYEMTANINDAIKYHKDEVEKAGTEEEKSKKREWLEDVLKKEKAAYEHDSVKFPDEAKKTLDQYAGISEARSFFGNKADEYIKVMSDKKDGAKIAVASLISKADQNMDLVNNYLDYLDNNTVQRLRDSNISIKVVEGRRVLYQVSLASINDSLNRSVLGKIGNNTAFKGFNLAEEGYAYFNAYVSAPTNEEGLKNLANEVIMRRVPGSGIAQAVVMENYVRAGIETAYLIFPPLAIPEAVVSLSYQVGSSGMSYGLGKFWESSLKEITEDIYAYSLFKPVPGSKGAEWKLTHLGYKGQKYSRDDLDKFFEAENRWIGAVFYKAVENDPVIVQLQKLMDNEYVGEKYRHKIEALWARRHDECQKELLNKIIHKLEERMAAEMLGQGVGAERMKEIRETLSCGMDTLVPESDNTEVNGEVYRTVILDYQKHMDAVKKIDALSEKTGVKLNYYKPVCSLDSLRLASERNPELEGRYEAMIEEISKELKEIKGGFRWDDESDKKDMADLLEYRKLAEPDLSNESDLWQKKYSEGLKKIRDRYVATVEDIVITPEEEIFAGEDVTFAVVLELDEKAGVTYSWEVSGVKYTDLTGKDSIQGGLKTVSDGTLTLDLRVIRDGKVIGERKESVEILPVTLEELRIEVDGKDTLDESNTSVHLRAYAAYSDGTEADITGDAVWEVVSGENVAVGKGGVVSLANTRSYTPSGDEKVRVKASYGDSAATIDIKVQQALSDLGSYWNIDPEYPEIPLDSDPRGIMVTFTAITDDPGNNDKREFKWQFEKEDGSEEKTGQEVNVFYKDSGQYGILLTVTDEWGNEDEEHDTIVIEEEYPAEEDKTEEDGPDKDGQDEEKPFVTPEGNRNIYKGSLTGPGNTLKVERYDWQTPLNAKAGFVTGNIRQYGEAGYFTESDCLKTGPIEKGTAFNPGYLAYYDEKSKGIRYGVLGTGQETVHSSVFVKEKPDYSHSGIINESVGDVKKDTIKIIEVLSRSFRVAWTTLDGKKYTAIVWKYSDHGGYTFEGEKATKPADLFVKEVVSELSEMFNGEREAWLKDEKLAAMVEEELGKMEEEEKGAVLAMKPGQETDRTELKERVAERIEKGERSDLLFVKGDGKIKSGKTYFKNRQVESEYQCYVFAVSTKPLPAAYAVKFFIDNGFPLIGPYKIVGSKCGNLDDNPNPAELVDVWEIRVPHGTRTFYKEGTGQLDFEITYDNGKLQGPFKFFDRYAWERGNYINGKKEGPAVLYDSFNGGNPVGQCYYNNDMREGQWVYRGPSGTHVLQYKNGYVTNFDHGLSLYPDDLEHMDLM